MVKILWVDDEIELLKPHVLFLQQKGYEVDTCNNGYDAIDMATEGAYDLIILDEMMPGMTGLETLPKIKEVRPTTPVIMVTKSEEENIMDKADGLEDRRLPHQARQPQPGAAVDQEERPPAAARDRADDGRLPRRSSAASPHALQMAEHVLRTGARIYRQASPRGRSSCRSPATLRIKEVLPVPEDRRPTRPSAKFVRRNYFDWINQRADDITPVMSHTLMRSQHPPRRRRKSQDDAAADRQFPLRPVAVDHRRCCAATTTWRSRRLLLRHSPHGDAIRPQRYLRRADAAGYRPSDARTGGSTTTRRAARTNTRRSSCSGQLQPATARTTAGRSTNWCAPKQGRKLVDNIQTRLRRRFLGDRLQLPRHPVACAHRDRHHPRADRGRGGVPLADALVVRTLRPLHACSDSSPKRGHTVIITSDHGTIRVDNPMPRDGRPRDLAQPALQDGAQPRLQLRAKSTKSLRPEDIQLPSHQPLVELYLRLQHRFSRLQQRRQPLHPLLPATRSSTAAFRWRR